MRATDRDVDARAVRTSTRSNARPANSLASENTTHDLRVDSFLTSHKPRKTHTHTSIETSGITRAGLI